MLASKDVVAIQRLQPETIIALEGVSFSTRALALPGVVEVSYSLNDVPMVDGQDDESIDVRRCMRIAPDTEECMLVLDRYIIAGGLAYDQDASNPLEEGTANGNIYHASTRRGSAEEQTKYYQALGLDADGRKDLDNQVVTRRLVSRVIRGLGNNLPVLKLLLQTLRDTGKAVSIASLKAELQGAIDQEGWKYALDYVADRLFAYPYWNRMPAALQNSLQPLADLMSESQAEECWDEAANVGEIGNPLAIQLDIYEHGGVAYSVSGSGMQCRWDTSRAAAVWVPDNDAADNILTSVLSELGLGEIRWFGSLGSTTDPLHARFALDGVTWVGEGKGWGWHEALEQMLLLTGHPKDHKELLSLVNVAVKKYCASILEEYNDWANGSVYGVLCYVIDRKTGRRLEKHDEETWDFIGHQYAEEELEGQMLALALQFGQSIN